MDFCCLDDLLMLEMMGKPRLLIRCNPILKRLFVNVASAQDDDNIAITVQADLAHQQRRRRDRSRWLCP